MDKRGLATDKYIELYGGDVSGKGDNVTHVSASADIKLPKLNLPVFGGDVLQWPSFWDQFEANVDSTDLSVILKFSYLRTLLEGEPKRTIEGLSLTADHYDVACSILKDRFGRKEIIFTHIQKLLNLSVPSKCTVASLWRLNNELKAHTRSLEALGIDGKQYGVILTPLILSHPGCPRNCGLNGRVKAKDMKVILTLYLNSLIRRFNAGRGHRCSRSHLLHSLLTTNYQTRNVGNVHRRRPHYILRQWQNLNVVSVEKSSHRKMFQTQ